MNHEIRQRCYQCLEILGEGCSCYTHAVPQRPKTTEEIGDLLSETMEEYKAERRRFNARNERACAKQIKALSRELGRRSLGYSSSLR